MTLIAHISDLHFGRENPRLIDGLMHSLEEVQPQLVVISGDLTQRARKHQFLAARAFLDRLPWPFLVIAGNHDIPAYNLAERFFTPWRKWHHYLAYTLQPVMKGNDYIAIGINTVRRSGSLIDWSRGRISHKQINVISGHLDDCEDKRLRVIVAHHPFWLPEKYRHRHIIGGRDMALELMLQAGVDIVLSGHVHFAYTHLLDGLIISHAGTAISNRLTANNRNSFKIVRGNRRRVTIETQEWNSGCFSSTEQRFFSRIQGKWMDDS